MKRVIIAVIVLCLSLSFSIYSYYTITNDCRALKQQTAAIESLLQTEQFGKIYSQKDKIKRAWKRDSLAFSLLTTHVHYDALEESIDTLCHACEGNDKKDIQKACESLDYELGHILTSIIPNGENVF